MTNSQKTILVVDDASLVRLFYRSTLEAVGFRVEEALNGLEALEKLLTISVDLLLVDVNMPTMDGLTFIDVLRQQERPISSIPTVVISSEQSAKDFAAARAAGSNFYLVKPVNRETLVEFAVMLCGASQ